MKKTSKSLKKHQKKIKKKLTNNGKYLCPDCEFRFDTKFDLKMHSYNHKK